MCASAPTESESNVVPQRHADRLTGIAQSGPCQSTPKPVTWAPLQIFLLFGFEMAKTSPDESEDGLFGLRMPFGGFKEAAEAIQVCRSVL